MSSQTAHNAIRFAPAARAVVVALLVLFLLWYLLPMWVLLVNSFKSIDEIRAGNLLSVPLSATIEPWQKAWSGACTGVDCRGLQPFFWNSVWMVVPAVLISTLIGAINGYVLSHWKFKGSDALFALLMLGCFIPFQVVILPMARLLGMVGLANTTVGLVFAHIVYGLAFTTLFFRNYYVSIPTDLVTAARMDGAGFWTIFLRIMLPLSGPIIMVTIIWQFTQIWNDFLFGIAFANGASAPITVALNNLVNTSTGVKEYNVDMAAAIIAGLPTLLVYVLAGKYFVRGLTAGSVKG